MALTDTSALSFDHWVGSWNHWWTLLGFLLGELIYLTDFHIHLHFPELWLLLVCRLCASHLNILRLFPMTSNHVPASEQIPELYFRLLSNLLRLVSHFLWSASQAVPFPPFSVEFSPSTDFFYQRLKCFSHKVFQRKWAFNMYIWKQNKTKQTTFYAYKQIPNYK